MTSPVVVQNQQPETPLLPIETQVKNIKEYQIDQPANDITDIPPESD
jgi:hypothetical protein